MCPPLDSSSLSTTTKLSAHAQDPPTFVPSDSISQAAYRHAASHVHPDILAHSMRVFLHAKHISNLEGESSNWHQPARLPILFTSCIFHDIGTSPAYDTGPTRFEIEGADAAVAFLKQHGIGEEDCHQVWIAIAIHDTPQIAERIAPLARLVRLGVAIDFKRPAALAMVSIEQVESVESVFPRGSIEKVLGDAVVSQALKCPEKAPAACWPGGLYRSKLENPDWEGVNKAF